MRYETGVQATRAIPPRVHVIYPPNKNHPAEVKVDFGGMAAWFSEYEATALGRKLIEAGIGIREAAKSEGRADEH